MHLFFIIFFISIEFIYQSKQHPTTSLLFFFFLLLPLLPLLYDHIF